MVDHSLKSQYMLDGTDKIRMAGELEKMKLLMIKAGEFQLSTPAFIHCIFILENVNHNYHIYYYSYFKKFRYIFSKNQSSFIAIVC